MELREFVAETLKQIVEGVKDAQAAVKTKGGQINPRLSSGSQKLRTISSESVQMVEFDVALTIVEGKGTKGGIGVFVGPLGIGSQGQSSSENTSVSRIKFQVPITLPEG